ncbi:hypothetical protein CF386_08715 [Paraphotobacterium marinum]|uniref:Uncharacterized protein n=1 Tax=Paraphotobacterium marinum TaxID=1755811 RepID=A0A220VFR2_9GAMM|nr:hypothetical protein [Paraphotobacterium marinum]ASK79141.1 hypothetical protein CF386_08715 [Paraphotobacterium marinum]
MFHFYLVFFFVVVLIVVGFIVLYAMDSTNITEIDANTDTDTDTETEAEAKTQTHKKKAVSHKSILQEDDYFVINHPTDHTSVHYDSEQNEF